MRSFKYILRIVELCFVLILLLWISTYLPFAVKSSVKYFRQLVVVILNPFIIFILCNFIAISIFFKSSGNFSGDSCFDEFFSNFSRENENHEILYEDKEMIVEENTVGDSGENSLDMERLKYENVDEISVKLQRVETEKCRKVTDNGEISTERYRKVTVNGDFSTEKCRKVTSNGDFSTEKLWNVKKHGEFTTEKCRKVTNDGVCTTQKCRKLSNSVKFPTEKYQKLSNYGEFTTEKRRGVTNAGEFTTETAAGKCKAQSENVNEEHVEEIYEKLRRSETEKCHRKVENAGEFVPPETEEYKVEELSNEEFQKTIEEFIAKQIKFHRQEKFAIVLHSQA